MGRLDTSVGQVGHISRAGWTHQLGRLDTSVGQVGLLHRSCPGGAQFSSVSTSETRSGKTRFASHCGMVLRKLFLRWVGVDGGGGGGAGVMGRGNGGGGGSHVYTRFHASVHAQQSAWKLSAAVKQQQQQPDNKKQRNNNNKSLPPLTCDLPNRILSLIYVPVAGVRRAPHHPA